MLWQHQWSDPLGRWLLIEERVGGPAGTGGLFVRGRLELKTRLGSEALALLAAEPRPAIDGLSIGFLPVETEWDVSGKLAFLEVDLWEVSLVTFPAQQAARVERSADAGLEPAKRELRALISDFKGAF
jgi:HK97 family phage prohead protease